MCLNFTQIFSNTTRHYQWPSAPKLHFFLFHCLFGCLFCLGPHYCNIKHPYTYAHLTKRNTLLRLSPQAHKKKKRQPCRTSVSFMFLKGQNAAQLAVFLRWRATCEWDSHLVRQWSLMGTKINILSTSDCIISQSPASQVFTLRCMILIWLFCSSGPLTKIRSKSCLQPFQRFDFTKKKSKFLAT